MDEINLIPNSYRERIMKMRMLKIFGFVFMFLFLTTGVSYAALEFVKRETNSEIIELSKIKDLTSKQRDNLKALVLEKKALEYQWALLNGLRTAVAAEDLFVAIDRSIQEVDIWFSSMRFQRTEVEINTENTVHSGYFIIVTPDDADNSLAIGTTMLIAGEAPNHSTLSTFVNNLIDQSEILDASVLETTSSKNLNSNTVRFNLAITVNLDSELI